MGGSTRDQSQKAVAAAALDTRVARYDMSKTEPNNPRRPWQEMTRIGFADRVYPATKLAMVTDALIAAGAPSPEALRGTRLTLDELHTPTTQISLDQLIAGYRNAIRLVPDPALAYRLGSNIHVSLYGMYGYALLCSTSFRRTMDFAVRYHQLAAPLTSISFAETREFGIWTIEPLLHPQMDAELYRFVVELQLGTHVSLHRDVMGPSFVPREACVTYRPADVALLPTLTACSVRYAQPANQLIFDANWLDAVPTLGNRITFAAVIDACDDLLEEMERRTGIAGRIRKILLQTLANRPTFAEIAGLLGTTTRTLRRQLRDENVSFRELMNDLRAHIAMKYLQETTMTNEDIAFALGFSDAANFRHAFRRWTKRTPREFRLRMGRERAPQLAR
jgi:AraC-like DNA-binding protein